MNRQQKRGCGVVLAALMTVIAGCQGEGGETEGGGVGAPSPTPAPLIAHSGVVSATPGVAESVNLAPYIIAGSGVEPSVVDVTLLSENEACGEVEIENGRQVGFRTQVDGSAMCRYQYTVEANANLGNESDATGVMTVVASTASNPTLVPIPISMTLTADGGPASVEIDIAAELAKVGDSLPLGYSLSSELSVLGDGLAQANTPSLNTLKYTAVSDGPQRIIYKLEDGAGQAHKFGVIEVAVSDGSNPPPQAKDDAVYAPMVGINQTIEIDLSLPPYVTSPDGEDFQLVHVNSFNATVVPKAPDDITNKVFTFNAPIAGEHYITYVVSDHWGGFDVGMMKVTVVDPVHPQLWDDIVYNNAIYTAPLTLAQATNSKAGASGVYHDAGYNPTVAVATFRFNEASAYCGTRGRLPTSLELQRLSQDQSPAANHHWPVGLAYWASDNGTAQVVDLYDGGGTQPQPQGQYVTCVANKALSVSALDGRALNDGEDRALIEATVHVAGAPKAGERVDALVIYGGATLVSTHATTNSQGQVHFGATDTTVEPVTIMVSWERETALQNVVFYSDGLADSMTLSMTSDSGYANGVVTNAATATVLDSGGLPVAGQLVSFNTDTSTSKVVDSAPQLVTNDQGKVTARVTDTVAEPVTITAEASTRKGRVNAAKGGRFIRPDKAVTINGSEFSPPLDITAAFIASRVTHNSRNIESGGSGPRGMEVPKYDWNNANQYCNQLNYNGRQDWRLPTRGELVALYNSTQGAGMWTKHSWTTGTSFWSSTSGGSGKHWHVYMHNGDAGIRDDNNNRYVSCITLPTMFPKPVTVGNLTFSPPLSVNLARNASGVTPDSGYTEDGSTGPAGMDVAQYHWVHADQYCNQLDYDGKQDWRLPSKDELMSLYNSTQGAGMWNKHGWAGWNSSWSSTKSAGLAKHYTVQLHLGYDHANNEDYFTHDYVSCVRTGV
ncbi:DUF1566 domain-containing protein [Vibrio splendidus]|uniref:Big-1 domain-containing protein n=1 Tax=Vibrio splendidus TaxID=29497 RepID=A0A0H3ZPZ7_VIBSP|nr:hypothetical protein [Vibrio splendidus]